MSGVELAEDICSRLDDILIEESPMHPFGCATWEESSRIAIDMAKDFIRRAVPMEAGAWREKVARIIDPHAFGLPVPGRGPLPGFVSNKMARDFNREGALTKADATKDVCHCGAPLWTIHRWMAKWDAEKARTAVETGSAGTKASAEVSQKDTPA